MRLSSRRNEMARNVNWARLSEEMTGNIRVGFAAGECIAGFEKDLRPGNRRLLWHAALVLAGVLFVALAPLVQLSREDGRKSSNRPDSLGANVQAYPPVRCGTGWDRLEAGPSAIEVKSKGVPYR